MTDLLTAALDYAARGWPVFPLRPRDKRPATSNGFKDATTDLEQIRRWWSTDEFNIGTPTGVVFDTLDLDTLEAEAAFFDRCEATGTMPTGPMTLTGRGLQVHYRPTGLGNRAGFLPGCDWRGRGGYIVLPPSIHPNGLPYDWAWDHGSDTPLTDAPVWLLGELERRPTPPTELHPPGGRSTYAAKAIEGELGRLAMATEGTRNDELNRSAFRLGQLAADPDPSRRVDLEDAARSLLTVALRIGLTEREAVATIRSGLRNGMAQPRRAAA